MNRITAAAVMTAALIAGTVPLTLHNIHEQKQREVVAEDYKELYYLRCLDDRLKIKLNWVEQDGVKTWYTADWKEFNNKPVIQAYEETLELCARLNGKDK